MKKAYRKPVASLVCVRYTVNDRCGLYTQCGKLVLM